MTISTRKGFTLWFTGLPCAGKTSLASALFKKFKSAGCEAKHLDGDVLRRSLSKDLGFSKKDRKTHVLRVANVASLLSKNGVVTLVSLISPNRLTRRKVRRMIGNFIEIYVRCPIEVCERRDVKGHYRLARAGRLKHFTGVSDPYEKPITPEITVLTDQATVEACVRQITAYLVRSGWIDSRTADPGKRPAKRLQNQMFPPRT